MSQVQQSSLYNFQDGVTVVEVNLDQNFEVLRVAGNDTDTRVTTLHNELASRLSGSSGGDKVKISAIAGLSATSVQGALQALKNSIDQTVLGQIADGSITKTKLAFNVDAIRIDTAAEMRIEVRDSDPVTPVVGRMWLRSDL